MEAASVRILNSGLLKPHSLKYPGCRLRHYPIPHSVIVAISANSHSPNPNHSSFLPPSSSVPHPNSTWFRSFQSLSGAASNFAPADSSGNKLFEWNLALNANGGDLGVVGGKGPLVTVVLLGWLGSKRRYLKRYVEMYHSRGFHAVTFVASVNHVLASDMGRKLEERMAAFARELGSWLDHEDGRDRMLIFHTFSNTGWLAYV